LWAVETPPTAAAPVGVFTNRRQFEMHPNPVTNKYLNILPLHPIEILYKDFPANIYFLK
jgi:hypothetical protein